MAGQMIQRGRDRWLLRFYKGRDPLTGERVYKSITFRGGKNQARAELDRMLREQREGRASHTPDLTLDEHLDRWFDLHAGNHYAPKTLLNYKGIINFDVRPTIGSVRLSELRGCPKIRGRSLNALDFVLEKQSHGTQDHP